MADAAAFRNPSASPRESGFWEVPLPAWPGFHFYAVFCLVRWEAFASRTHNRVGQCETHLDVGLDLDGYSVELGRTVAPFAYRLESGLGEQWVTCPSYVLTGALLRAWRR